MVAPMTTTACQGPLDGADTNNVGDVYVRGVAAGTTTLITRIGNTGAVGNGPS